MKKKPTANSTSSNGPERLKPFQWQPGQSGNPAGRSPDDFLLARLHREKLREPVPKQIMETLAELIFEKKSRERAQWLKQPLTWAQAIVLRNLYRAMTPDDDSAVKLIWEHLEGKPVLKIAGHDGVPLIDGERDEKEERRRLSADEIRTLMRLKLKAQGETVH